MGQLLKKNLLKKKITSNLNLINFFWVAVGGSIGASIRFLTTTYLKYLFPSLPLGTLLVNILGSFIIGFLVSYMEYKNVSTNFIKYFLIIGLLGSFTTFSAFSYEIFELIVNKKFLISFFYIIVSVLTCIFFCFLGYNLNKI